MISIVTGGAGFIGSHLCKALLDLGHQVIAVDNLRTGFRSNVPDGVTFLELDVSDENYVKHLPKHCDYFFHLAANSSGEVSFYEPGYDLKSNALSTLISLMWCQEAKVKKFVFASSLSVYGDPVHPLVSENNLLKPKSFYGVGKLASEHYIKIFNDLGMDTAILRLFNVFGPGQNMANMRQGMLSIYLAYLLKKQPIVVKGSLNRSRDFVYIDDVVNAMLLSMQSTHGDLTLNICSNREVTVKTLLNELISSCGLNDDYPILNESSTPRDQHQIYGDNTLAKKLIGWQPMTTLEQGIRLTVESLRDAVDSHA